MADGRTNAIPAGADDLHPDAQPVPEVSQLTAHIAANAAAASIASLVALDIAGQNLRTMLIIGKTYSSSSIGATRPKSADSLSTKNRTSPLMNTPPLNT